MKINSAKLIVEILDESTGELITREATLEKSGIFKVLSNTTKKRGGKREKSNTKEFIEKAIKIHGNKYDYSKVEYINNHTKVCIICPEHGEFWQTPNDHLSKKAGCPKCYGVRKHSKKSFIEKANKVHNNKYDYSLVDYINNKSHVKIICPIHGVFEQRPDKHLIGLGCPKCKKSHGETLIENILLENNINYFGQHIINIDTSINPSGKAFIDFYLPEYNLFIEYNGELHYISRNHFGKCFKKQVERDDYVRNYCNEHGIRLLEIPYTEKHVKEILIKYIDNIK